MDRPLVSIVVPSLNSGRFVKQALDSILTQGYPSVECIVMDGGSEDETVEILKGYSSCIKWESGPDKGQAHALNKGFTKSKGEILSWLNSDDVLLPGAVGRAVEYLMANPHVSAVYGDVEWVDEEGRVMERRRSLPFDLNRLINYFNYIPQMGTFFRRSAFQKVGPLDERLRYAMDYDLWIRLGKMRPLGYLEEFQAQWRIHKGSKTGSSPLVAMRENIAVSRRHGGRTISPMLISAILWRAGAAPFVRIIRKLLEARWRESR
jgi:glycosyltransferase involved in cell wall biosynthesis